MEPIEKWLRQLPIVHEDPATGSNLYVFPKPQMGAVSPQTERAASTGPPTEAPPGKLFLSLAATVRSCVCPTRIAGLQCQSPPNISDIVFVTSTASAPPGPPAISANGVISAASFQPGIAPNSWVAIVGNNLASTTDDWSKSIVGGKFPTTLDGVSVTIGGKPAYTYYITPGQLNVLTPDVGEGDMPVVVKNAAGTSATFTVTSRQYAPAFFPWPGCQACATRPDFSLAARNGTFTGVTTTPAKPGDVIILWGTGFGPTNPSVPVGEPVPSDTTYSTTTLPAVTVNGVAATVYGAALAPGFAGLYQIAIQVPNSLPDGDWPIQATIGGVQSPAGVMLEVRK